MRVELFNEIQEHLADIKRTADLVSHTLNCIDKELLLELPSDKMSIKDKLDLIEILSLFCKQRGLKSVKEEHDFASEIFTYIQEKDFTPSGWNMNPE